MTHSHCHAFYGIFAGVCNRRAANRLVPIGSAWRLAHILNVTIGQSYILVLNCQENETSFKATTTYRNPTRICGITAWNAARSRHTCNVCSDGRIAVRVHDFHAVLPGKNVAILSNARRIEADRRSRQDERDVDHRLRIVVRRCFRSWRQARG